MARKDPTDLDTDGGKQVPARPHDSGSGANETIDGLDATAEALRHAAEDTRPARRPMTSKKSRFSTAPALHRKSESQARRGGTGRPFRR